MTLLEPGKSQRRELERHRTELERNEFEDDEVNIKDETEECDDSTIAPADPIDNHVEE